MAIESAYSSAVALRLNNGVTGAGTVKSVTVSIPKVVHGADADKIMSVVGGLLPCLELPLIRVIRTEQTVIEG
jgi:hypothetical protein